MDLIVTQRLLARLYTDEGLCQRFFAHPADTAAEFGIAADAAQDLGRLASSQVAGFSRSLVRKRLQEVRRALPATCQALGPRLEELFARHAAAFHPRGPHRHAADALAFADFLARRPLVISSALADLARYEANSLRFRLGRSWPVIALFRSDPRRISPAEADRAISSRFTLACWFRFAGRVRHLALTLPFALSRRVPGAKEEYPQISQISAD